jgi:hypothetical protein
LSVQQKKDFPISEGGSMIMMIDCRYKKEEMES